MDSHLVEGLDARADVILMMRQHQLVVFGQYLVCQVEEGLFVRGKRGHDDGVGGIDGIDSLDGLDNLDRDYPLQIYTLFIINASKLGSFRYSNLILLCQMTIFVSCIVSTSVLRWH